MINTDLVHVPVHWCQEEQSKTGIGQKEHRKMQYYMDIFVKYCLDDDADIARLRLDLNRIQDWNLRYR